MNMIIHAVKGNEVCQILNLQKALRTFPHTWGTIVGLILGLRPANERWPYFVTTFLIGWVQA